MAAFWGGSVVEVCVTQKNEYRGRDLNTVSLSLGVGRTSEQGTYLLFLLLTLGRSARVTIHVIVNLCCFICFLCLCHHPEDMLE